MLKFSDAAPIIHRKIAMNNRTQSIFIKKIEILENEKLVCRDFIKFFDIKIELINQINKIECLQISEFCLKRQDKVTSLVAKLNDMKIHLSKEQIYDMQKKHSEIEHLTNCVSYIKSTIPLIHTVSNYNISISVNDTDCRRTARGL
jgi:hypothetical protein